MSNERDELMDMCIQMILLRAKTESVDTDAGRKKIFDDTVATAFSFMGKPFSEEEREQMRRKVEYYLSVDMKSGSILAESDYVPWYFERKTTIESRFWSRFQKLLLGKLPRRVMAELDLSTSVILDYMGDPTVDGKYQRKGLVIGDVQSGKTNSYLSVICKAIDAGYNFIIILAGTSNSLRMQTQIRVDESIIGFNSDPEKSKERIGVGLINPELKTSILTDVNSDFKYPLKNLLISSSDPIVLVIKKNNSILKNVFDWLNTPQNKGQGGSIDKSLVLIDDEADNASINTSGDGDNITAINKSIRNILSLFSRSSYVGYTATPYASIFIDPDSYDEMVKEDLFPKDFIYSMWAPSNYIGPRSLFEENGKHHHMVRTIPSKEDIFEGDFKHKKDAKFEEMPLSLRSAIASFFVACALRDLVGDRDKPMSMMIHITRFIAVQEKVYEKISEAVSDLKEDILSYYSYSVEDALKHATMKFIYDIWKTEYSSLDWPHNCWVEIQSQLYESVAKMKEIVINSENEKGIDYRRNPKLRAVVIGGNALSRGLTLEGLMISYFYRKSKQYDTLLQMGRWFGYKEGFDELCRVWTNKEVQSWLGYIGRVNDELKHDIDEMCDLKKTPSNFGLRVQQDITGFSMTSANKMRTSQRKIIYESLSGEVRDTMYVHVEKNTVVLAQKITTDFYERLENYRPHIQREDAGNIVWTDIPYQEIINFLEKIPVSTKNAWYGFDEISKYVTKLDKNWDVAIISRKKDASSSHNLGPKEPYSVNGMSIYCPRRGNFMFKDCDKTVIQMGNRNLKSPEDFSEFLGADEVKKIKANRGDRSPSAKDYMVEGRNPALLIYHIELTAEKPDMEDEKKMIQNLRGLRPIGFALGFPRVEDSSTKLIEYQINKVAQRIKEDHEYNE